MANSSGTFNGSTDLLVKLNTFLVANSWTRLNGETDLVPASPKSARYWRILVLSPGDPGDNYREIKLMTWHETSGEANLATDGSKYTISNAASGDGSDLVSGTDSVLSENIGDNWWTVMYDFSSGTAIKEITITSENGDYAPGNFLVQWSHDSVTWTTMKYYEDVSWADGFTHTFTWDEGSGYTDSHHISSTIARRSGEGVEGFYSTDFDKNSEMSDNIWSWQGPGFDADRRVYVSAINFSDAISGDDHIRFAPHTEYDSSVPASSWFTSQSGSPQSDGKDSTYLLVPSGSGSYWFYLSDSRIFIVVKKGVSDYTSAYIGFLSQFALPDDYPFPLYVGGTTDDLTEFLNSTNANVRDAVDPGDGSSALYRNWDNEWISVENHLNGTGVVNDPNPLPDAWTWPFHTGQAGRNEWPDNTVGDRVDWDAHYLDRIDATVQGDLPFIPVIVMNSTYGNIGALDGIFCVPSGGLLSAEQTITISSVDYRIFNTRSKIQGMNFYAVRED